MKKQVPDISNPFRQALAKGRPLVGIWGMLNSLNATEGLAWAGFDWLLIDQEHAPVSLQDTVNHLRILDGTPTAPIVRLPWNDNIMLKRNLDAGVCTFMLPFVQNAAQAQAAVDAMRYPPLGKRGMAGMQRASRYGHVPDYLSIADSSLYLIVQIETLEAINNLDEILAIDGVDAVFFGPSDLSADMGILGGAGGPEVTEKILSVHGKLKGAGKAFGVLSVSDRLSKVYIEAGFDFVSVTSDCAMLFRNANIAADEFVSVAKGAANKTLAS